ncbi:MAG: GGDEF domain-containing protein, partial [Firmicutes bacterium]|nr:GGDEF domain-containing protein [Bacillota bacterium]
NIFLTDYYKTAMSGENAISESTVVDEDGDEVLVLAVPITRNDTTVGVIYGTFTKEVLNSIIDTMNFAGTSTNVLLNKNGTIIAMTDEGNTLPDNTTNLFDVVKEAKNADSDKNTTYTYRKGMRTYSMVMTPIGAHDWYFATILPDSVVAAQTAAISRDVFTEMAGVVILSVLLLFFVLRVMRENDIKKLYLMQKAERDALTGILNKGAFESYVENMAKTASTEEMGLYYIIDLDNFKKVNDTFGHEMGDKVLREVSEKINEIFGSNDFVGRIGGDEFAAYHIVTAEEKKDITAAAQKYGSALCESIRKTYEMDNKQVNVSASIGISVYPKTGGDYGGLYRSADKALYHVKDRGKNNFEIYENEPEVTL